MSNCLMGDTGTRPLYALNYYHKSGQKAELDLYAIMPAPLLPL